MSVLYLQTINMVIVVLLLGIPVLLTWLFFKFLGFKRDQRDDLAARVKELEERLQQMEEDPYDHSE